MTKREIYKKNFNEDDWPGLESIYSKTKLLYSQQEPNHLAPILPYDMGGEEPLWATDCFVSEKQEKHFHLISLGFTNLWYDEDFAEDEINGFGFELTFRHLPIKDDPETPLWSSNFIQNIAKYVFKTRNCFDDFHYMSANGPIREDTETDITAMAFYTDSELGEIDSPHGKIKFLQIFGITTNEYQELREKKYSVEELIYKHKIVNPLLITDLDRK